MRIGLPFVFASTLALAAALPLACGGGGAGQTGSATTHGSGGQATSSGAGNSGSGLFFDGGNDPVVSIQITPAAPSVEVLNGVIPAPVTFTATGKTMGGVTQANLQCDTWSYDRQDVATLAANSLGASFTATGLNGGQGTVTCKYGGVKGTTSATVKLHLTSDPQNVDPATKMQFGQASAPDGVLKVLYPYDKTVFPRGLTGPTLQWNGGGAADIYYVHAVCPTFELETWTTVPPPSRYAFDATPTNIWKKLTDSTSGDITVTVQRHDGSQPYLPVTRTWTIAPANLTGTIYFWEVNQGNVVRLKPGDTVPENFIQKPAGVTCLACHSVSKNGSTIVAAANGGASPWGTYDAATGNALYYSGVPSGFEAISPDGQYVLWRDWIDASFNSLGHLSLSKFNDATELAQLNPGSGFPVHPAWSGDALKVAFAVRTDGNGLDFNNSALWTTDVDLATTTFSNTHQIVAADPARTTVTFPTFSPDSKWIAYERATRARSRGAQSDISLTSADGSTQIPLDQANGVGLLTGSEASSTYEPTFMPIAAGGYFWLIVVSERTYGNTLTDTAPPTRRKQLWVTAVDATPKPGQDPSHPAFWLPGQDIGNNNMRGEWALSPCKKLGDTCTAGYDCCDGFCHDDGMGKLTCSNSGGGGCSQIGEACKTGADCCDPTAACIGGFCANSLPH